MLYFNLSETLVWIYLTIGGSMLVLLLLVLWGASCPEVDIPRSECAVHLCYIGFSAVVLLCIRCNNLDQYFVYQLGLLGFALATADQSMQLSLSAACSFISSHLDRGEAQKLHCNSKKVSKPKNSTMSTAEMEKSPESKVVITVPKRVKQLRFSSDPDE